MHNDTNDLSDPTDSHIQNPPPVPIPIDAQMREVAKDPTRPTRYVDMTPRQLTEQRAIAIGRWKQALVHLGQCTPAELVDMGLEELMANVASQLEQKVAAKSDYDQFYAMKEEQKEIVLFLRDQYQREIDAGQHQGRTLSAVVCGYLAVERRSWGSRLRRMFL